MAATPKATAPAVSTVKYDATASASMLSRLRAWVHTHTHTLTLTVGAVAVVGLGGYLLYRATVVPPAFKTSADDAGEGSDGKVRFSDERDLPEHMHALVSATSDMDTREVFEQMIQAIHDLRAEGVFQEREAAVMGREFATLARAASTQADPSHLRLTRNLCRFVFEKIGVKDHSVADRIYDTWNTDGSEGIDLKEFLHAVVLVLRGTPSQKLEMMYRIMDIDGDGWVSKQEMVRFFTTVYASSGRPRSPEIIQAQVDRMYDSEAKTRQGFLSQKEFMALATDAKFHVGETLTQFLRDLTERFSEAMGTAAGEYRAKRAASQQEDEGEEEAAAAQPRGAPVPMKRASSIYK